MWWPPVSAVVVVGAIVVPNGQIRRGIQQSFLLMVSASPPQPWTPLIYHRGDPIVLISLDPSCLLCSGHWQILPPRKQTTISSVDLLGREILLHPPPPNSTCTPWTSEFWMLRMCLCFILWLCNHSMCTCVRHPFHYIMQVPASRTQSQEGSFLFLPCGRKSDEEF